MEGGLELEDDVFFKDLSKQISLLIMDDDDDDDSLAHCPLNLQAFTQAIHDPSRQASFPNYDHHHLHHHHHHHHQTINKRSEISKGTGVFIPRSSSNLRRKNVKQGKSCSGSKSQTRPNNNNPSHDQCSVNLRRF